MEIFLVFNLEVSDFIIRHGVFCLLNRFYIYVFICMHLEYLRKDSQKPVTAMVSGKEFD